MQLAAERFHKHRTRDGGTFEALLVLSTKACVKYDRHRISNHRALGALWCPVSFVSITFQM